MKNPITDKSLSLDSIGMLYILAIILKQNGDPTMEITRRDIEQSMRLKTGLDQKHDIQLKKLAQAGYIRQENRDGIIFITLL